MKSAALSLAAGLILALAGAAHAGIEIRQAALAAGEEAITLSAELDIDIQPVLADVVARGVPLYLVLEFELTRPRWYWFDETVAARTLTYRLSYHALTRQYRLSTGALHQSFATLAEAVAVMSRLRDWPVADKTAAAPGAAYQAGLRMRLDLTRLPKPIQVGAIGAAEWSLASEWLRWSWRPEREAK
ncbi:MAG: DUF4390 domain-containing protein [Rhodocyclaceae bacterium]